MSDGTVTALEQLRVEASTCTRCPLAGGRTQVVFGVGDPEADLLFVGEGPGREEDLAGEPFVGRSGKLLDRLMLEEIGLTRQHCYIANVVKCRPPKNRDPAPDEIAACRPYLERQVELIAPAVIVTLGNFATRLLLDSTEGIRQLRGSVFPYGAGHLVPTYPPAYVLRAGGEAMAEMRADLVRAKRLMARAAP
jgi:uracil-DNA glycosylase family 4